MTEDNASFVTHVEYATEHDKPKLKRAVDQLFCVSVETVLLKRLDDNLYWLCLLSGDDRQVVTFEARGLIVARTGAE